MFKLRRQQQNAVRQASFGGLSISSKTSEELILEGANDAPQSNYCGYAVRIFYVIAYFAVGVVVYTQVEERECDDQPDVKTFTGVNVTIGDYFCENCIVMEDVETCYTPWTVVDTLYWSTVTVTTVGYGDYSPTTDAGRIFGFFYIIFGLGVVLGVIQSFVNNAIDRVEQNAKQRGRGGIDASELDETPQEITAQLYRKVAVSIGIIIAVSLLGGVIYSALEDWTYLDGVWWAFITSLTIGYGDQNLTSESSRIFSIFFVMGMVTLMTVLMGNLSGASYRLKVERKRAMLLETSLTPEVIDALDRDGDGVDRFEFVFGMLKLLDIVTEQDVVPWIKKFDELDADNSGKLDRDDLVVLARELSTIHSPRSTPVSSPAATHSPMWKDRPHPMGSIVELKDENGDEGEGEAKLPDDPSDRI